MLFVMLLASVYIQPSIIRSTNIFVRFSSPSSKSKFKTEQLTSRSYIPCDYWTLLMDSLRSNINWYSRGIFISRSQWVTAWVKLRQFSTVWLHILRLIVEHNWSDHALALATIKTPCVGEQSFEWIDVWRTGLAPCLLYWISFRASNCMSVSSPLLWLLAHMIIDFVI